MSAEKRRQCFARRDDATVWGGPTRAPLLAEWMLFVRLASGHQLREVRRPFLLLPISLLWQAPPAALPLPLISFLVVFSLRAPPQRLSVVRGFPTCFGCLARYLRPPLLA
jgi:hypothetical protein